MGMAGATSTGMLMPTVSRYMTRGPHAIASRDKVSTALNVMRRYQIHHLPVVDDHKLVGIVTDRDLIAFHVFDDHVADAMTKTVAEVNEGATLDEVLARMQTGHSNSVVVTGNDGVEGIFTSTDAMRAFADVLQRTDDSER
jgi:acetoin utilization protein AcuB